MARVDSLAVFLTCLVLTVASSGPAWAIDRLAVGASFPEFSLPRADGAGGEYSSAQIQGKTTVIIFWRPKQSLSAAALRDLKSIVDDLGAEKVTVLGVDAARSTTEQVRTALAGEAIPFPVVSDPKRKLYGEVGVIVSPTTLVLDKTGKLRFVLASRPRTYRQVIRARVRFLLGEIDQEAMQKEIEPTVLQIDHELAAAWRMYNLGRRLQTEGKAEEAATVLEEAVSRYPSLTEARCSLGFLKFSSGDLAAAAKHFRAALAHSPTAPLARLGKALVLARTGRSEEAEHLLLPLLGQRSVAARVRYELGRIYDGRGQSVRALTFYRDGLRVIFPEPGGTATPPDPSVATAPPPPRVSSARSEASPGTTSSGGATLASSSSKAPGRASGRTEPSAVTPVTPPADAKYRGTKTCKKCHFQQWKSWKDTRMAAALDLLAPGARAEEKRARDLDPQRDYSSDKTCLACHTTGFGHAGGYPERPPTDTRGRAALGELAGISCESCHGPGSRYAVLHKAIQDKRRKYTIEELLEVGQYRVDERVCVVCHDHRAPCIAPESTFDFALRKEKGTHKHYALQFRSQ